MKAKKQRRRRRAWLPRSTAKAFTPYVTAIGQAALQWNILHEALGSVFMAVMQGKYDYQYAGLWGVGTSDRGRRELLKAAATGRWIHPNATAEEKEWQRMLAAKVKELVGAVEALEDARNNAVHAPLYIGRNALTPSYGHVLPDISLENARALRLENKDLLAEYRWCREYAISLGDFATDIYEAITEPKKPWPDKPRPPNREPKRSALASRRLRP